MSCLHQSSSRSRGSSGQHASPRSTALTALALLLLGGAVRAAPQQRGGARRLLQVEATSATPVNINAGSAAAGAEPQVTAQGGPAFDAFKSIASNALGNLLHKKEETPVVQAAPAQPVATIVVPPQQVAAVPTTTSGISLKTDTPVTVASPINVTTPVKQKNVQVDLGKGGEDLGLLNTLINLGNLGANSLAAGGAITGAVAGFLNTFLPDCPPPIVGAPPIPGCQLFEVVGAGPARPGRRAGAVAPAAVKADSTQAAPKLTATGGPAAAGPAKPMGLPNPLAVFQGIMGWP